MPLALLVFAVLAAAGIPAGEGPTIVVTARSLADTERDLAACLARRCPPKEDIAASLAHGENLFLAGQFGYARTTLGRARDRNLRYAKDLPVEVADLTRAYGRMSTFDGYEDLGRIAQIDSLDALKAGFGGDDARVLLQRLMVGDEFVRAGRLVAGTEVYRTVEKQAASAGLPRVLGFAMLRQAVVYGAVASVAPRYRDQARAKLARLERTTDPALAEFRDAAGLLTARLAALAGDERAMDAAIVAVTRQHPSPRPVLVYAPPVDLDLAAIPRSTVVSTAGTAAPQWIDVAFDVDGDGRVRTFDVVRRSSNVVGTWPERVRSAVLKRRYTQPATGTAEQRVERFALVYTIAADTRSRLRTRSPIGRVVTLDLTADPPAS